MSLKIAKSLSLKSADGVLVLDVVLGGASDKAGFKRGDLFLKFAGKRIKDFNTMVKAAGAIKHGQTIKVAILRHGKPMTLSLTLGKWTAPWLIKKSAAANLPASGLTMASLTQKLRKGFGLRRGDLIVQVNKKDVWLPDQLITEYKAAKKAGCNELLLLVERLNGYRFMPFPAR